MATEPDTCPRCGARPGMPCTTPFGYVTGMHRNRPRREIPGPVIRRRVRG